MSGKNKQKKSTKKTAAQLQQYRNYVNGSSYSPSSTIPSQNEMLIGSDEVNPNNPNDEIRGKEEVLKTPLRYRFIDWIKANLFAAIITAIVIGIGTAVISHMVKIAVANQQIEYLESEIQSIEDKYAEKTYLEAQIELLKAELSVGNDLSFNDIKWQLKEIEERLNDLENEKR